MSVYYEDNLVTLMHGDALEIARTMPDASVQTIVTSPPYFGLRDYGQVGQIGAEKSLAEYVERMVELFRELRRVLSDDGTLWLNLGDSYANTGGGGDTISGLNERYFGRPSKSDKQSETGASARAAGSVKRETGVAPKNLLGVPWRVALALQDDGWILRSDIIWAKPNPMPESVTDRPTKAHEYLFLFAKSPRYYYDGDAIAESTVGGAKGSSFTTGKTATHQMGRAGAGERERPQLRRAFDLAREKGLTEDHLAAIRAVGMNDAGKAISVQSGAGKNRPDVQHLADEAKTALGGYYREFLTGGAKNKRTVWEVPTVPFPGSHFAVYPPELIRPCILAGSRPGDVVLDPFSGSGTTGMVATQEGRRYVGIDLKSDYLDLSLRTRFAQPVLDMTGGAA